MSTEAHIAAAYQHERAAKSHRTAAAQSDAGAREACEQSAVSACEHSTKADEASIFALGKSVRSAKPEEVGAKYGF
jgi:hypothetical protein